MAYWARLIRARPIGLLMPYDGLSKCPTDARAIMIYNILGNRPITVLVKLGGRTRVLDCRPGLFDDVSRIIESVYGYYEGYILEFDSLVRSLREGRLSEARAIGEALGGVFGVAFTSLLSTIIGKVRRGGAFSESDLEGLLRIIEEEEDRRIYSELSRKYTVLDAEKYTIVTNGPPGIYRLPESPVEVDNLLASLGLGVVVKESIDVDVAFANILKANSEYARVLLDAYLRLRGLLMDPTGIRPWIIPMIVKSLENGHLTIIRGNRLFEYPSISIDPTNVVGIFEDVERLGWV